MIGWLIIACEVGFWIFAISGLFARYVLKKKRLGTFLLICTPVVDVILLIVTVADLKNGAVASTVHGLAAIYIGASVAYGHRMIQWADERFAFWFAGRNKPAKKPRYGKARARIEREGWYLHVLAWIIGGAVLGAIIWYVGNASQTEALWRTLQLWTVVLVVDFIISFSYTLFPKKQSSTSFD
ncbi:hypothetical protein ACGTN9_11545 [Halobacillus sp. MO56]